MIFFGVLHNITTNTKRINQIHKNQICANNLTSIFWKTLPLFASVYFFEVGTELPNFEILKIPRNFIEEPPCLLLHYFDYNNLLKWWLKSPMLIVAPIIDTNETKNDPRVPYDPDTCMVWNVSDEMPWKPSMWKLNPSLKRSPTHKTGTLLCKDELK